MTNDYKKNTLDYITGNLEIEETKANNFRDTSSYTNNFKTTCQNTYNFTPDTVMYLTTDTTSNFIIYGNYNDNGDYKGYIAVLNQNGNIETVFKTFDSGTSFSYIEKLQYAEDGNIYGVDSVDNRLRVILLNNVALKGLSGYSCRLRNSYYIPDDYNTLFAGWNYDTPGYIKKAIGKATYYLVGETQASGTQYRPTILKFVINVGSTNEWTAYYGTASADSLKVADFYIEPGEDNDKVVGLFVYEYLGVTEYTLENGEMTITASYPMPTNANSVETGRIVSERHYFLATRNSRTSAIYECKNGVYELVTYRTLADTNYSRRLCYINGMLFDKLRYYNNGSGTTYVGVYDKVYVDTEIGLVTQNSGLEVLNNYGLYQMLIQDENKLVKPSYVNYQPAYSGESYTNYNSLVPLHSELYSNGKIVFARNLYNKNIYGNTTVATANVPRSYLNDIPIQPKNLLSATMTTLASDTEEFTKNIYEDTFINFTNKIYVTDEEAGVDYPNTANYINTGINTGTEEDYIGSKISKIRINYSNGHSYVMPIEWEDISSGSLIAKQTRFLIHVARPISSIEFINEDETFTYIRKTYNNLVLDGYYNMTQKIRIE